MSLVQEWIRKNQDVFFRLCKNYFMNHLTAEQMKNIRLQRKYNLGNYEAVVRREFTFFMLEQAERMLIKRRIKMRRKSINLVRKIVKSSEGQSIKDNQVNYLIENELRYFSKYTNKADKKLDEIRALSKKVEESLKDRDKLLRQKQYKEKQLKLYTSKNIQIKFDDVLRDAFKKS